MLTPQEASPVLARINANPRKVLAVDVRPSPDGAVGDYLATAWGTIPVRMVDGRYEYRATTSVS